jgi:SAM-dependent methyltransferase
VTSVRLSSRPGTVGVFDASNAAQLAAADTWHWWFRGKAELVNAVLARWAPSTGLLVDVGAGSGGVTSMVRWRGRRVALEGSPRLVTNARSRGLDAVQADVLRLPFKARSASAVCLLDVIEHLRKPVASLAEARRVVAGDGVVVVTVPAHEWLWSATDEALGHHRRYTMPALRADLAQAELHPLWMSHAFSWCVPPVWLVRRAKRSSAVELGIEPSRPAVTRTADALNSVERTVLRRVPMPFGTSIVTVARAL